MKRKVFIVTSIALITAFSLILWACETASPPPPPPSGQNHDPVLSAGSVTPDSGDTSTVFVYEVTYFDEDGDTPATIEVSIDGNPYTMILYSGSADNGTYRYSRALAPGDHDCYFSCSDGNGGSDRLPDTGTTSGPTVTGGPGNIEPVLFNGDVSPDSGDGTTSFTYSVDYFDSDGDAPVTMQVFIDGSPSIMSLSSGSDSDGTYTYQTTLSSGTHDYYFYCEDGNGGTDRLPDTGTTSGPTVNNNPELSSGGVAPASGDTDTVFTYSVDYFDSDGDAPASIQVIIDGSASSMGLSSGTASNGTYSYQTTLSTGNHNFYFTCSDGNGGSDRLPDTGTTSGPSVALAPNNLSGTVNYTGSETIDVTQPLRVEIWSSTTWNLIDSAQFSSGPYSFSFDLVPDTYAAYAYIDMDLSGDSSEGDIFIIYDGIYFLDDYDVIDLTGGDQVITIDLDDYYIFGFFEDFSDGVADNWFPAPPDSRWQVINEEYRMVGTTDDDVTATVYYRNDLADFVFSVTLDQLAGDFDYGDWGMLFRFDLTTYSGFALWVDNDGWWGLVSLVNGVATDIHDEDTFTPGDTVAVECFGDLLAVYINGSSMGFTNVSSYGHTQGYVGLYAWDDSTTGTDNVFSFDDVWLVEQ